VDDLESTFQQCRWLKLVDERRFRRSLDKLGRLKHAVAFIRGIKDFCCYGLIAPQSPTVSISTFRPPNEVQNGPSHDHGLITEEEYRAKKQQILEQF
jgi:hypothetical protein